MGPLSASSHATSTNSLTTAVVAAAAALCVAIVTQYWTGRRERELRRWTWQREALLETQDAALALRGRLNDYGAALERARASLVAATPNQPTDVTLRVDREVETRVADAEALFDVRVARVFDPAVGARFQRWLTVAKEALVASEGDTPRSEESTEWRELNDLIGEALRGPNAAGSLGRVMRRLTGIVLL